MPPPGKLDPKSIDCRAPSPRASTPPDIPDPDLLVRTSGEMRVSNFLLWQISYAEIVIFKKFWPDFRQGDLFEAVEEYNADTAIWCLLKSRRTEGRKPSPPTSPDHMLGSQPSWSIRQEFLARNSDSRRP